MAELAVEAADLDPDGGGARDDALVVETVTRHAAALLRTARRHSLCLDDAHDAYQRALEIFLTRAARLRRETVVSWLHQVVKHEAMAVREARQRLVASEEVDLDAHACGREPSADERVVSFDRTARAAEALGRLKPHEVTALWLKAQGLSYQEIAERQSWSYTKVNRCLTEGRKAFLERYAGIESGDECRRWAPVVSALVDGELTASERREVRAHLRHCPGCRSTVRELRAAGPSLAAVLPVPLALADGGDALGRAGGLLARAYEALAGGTHERLAGSVLKLQAAAEAASTGKMAAVAASAAAIATGGAIGAHETGVVPGKPVGAHGGRAATAGVAGGGTTVAARSPRAIPRSAAAGRTAPARRRAGGGSADRRHASDGAPRGGAPEFGFEAAPTRGPAPRRPSGEGGPVAGAASASAGRPAPRRAPAAASNGSPEFGFEAPG
ncbi:MAG TPA: sigma-70 family RNA polymerase sigma factor [Solirubrobacteraceae bacterium]